MKKKAVNDAAAGVDPETDRAIDEFNDWKTRYQQEELVYQVRGKEVRAPLFTHSLSHSKIPRISIPRFDDPAEQYKWVRKENFAGCFPYTAGVFPLKRSDEDPTRMFAGEGGPEDTNKRFKLLSHEYPAKRLSTAFDSVTLYGFDPDIRQYALSNVRGTVQADILKEDQGQNTCIFSIEFALRMMGDIQQYFIDHQVRNFYSVSISGYHIAEAGANPITQLALTLANGFTYVEYWHGSKQGYRY